ncbi:hypothetical protein HMPREF2531_00160, partial [Bacteroides intestinalis]
MSTFIPCKSLKNKLMKEENLDEKVPVRAYTKADLAMLYNPGV